jgi:hypothetical protein
MTQKKPELPTEPKSDGAKEIILLCRQMVASKEDGVKVRALLNEVRKALEVFDKVV